MRNWIKNSEIPADQRRGTVSPNSTNATWESSTTFWRKPRLAALRNAIDQKIGDLYGSCMDEKAVDAKGFAPLKPELDRIAAVKDKEALIDEIAHIHLIGPNPLFNFYSSSDLHNADQVIAYIDQGGLSLPDRDYYIKDDAEKVEMRKHLAEYVTQLFTLAGQTPQQAAEFGANRSAVETALAPDSMDRTKTRRSQEPRSQDDARRGRRARAEFLS